MATTVIVFLLNIYYIVILAWDVYYMSLSFDTVLPWSHCNNDFNTEKYGPYSLYNRGDKGWDRNLVCGNYPVLRHGPALVSLQQRLQY